MSVTGSESIYLLFLFFEVLEFSKGKSNVVATVPFICCEGESRHEGGVKVAGCSFSSLRRSNIFVISVCDMCVT